MNKKYFCFVLLLIFAGFNCAYAQYVGIIPQPQAVSLAQDSLRIPRNINVYSTTASQSLQYLRENALERFQVYSSSDKTRPSLVVFQAAKKAKDFLNEEGYELIIGDNIVVVAGHEQGYFNAVNSLLQLMDYYKTSQGIKIPKMHIKDAPAYGWRGFMLDESRHFFGKDKVKQLLDWMAYYKLNKFHWHLTDEPAWRVEIKQYPFLTLIGGVGSYLNPLVPAQYYTQADIREIVAYAAYRHIEVIPEIDMPGHATAANRAYPQFSGGGTKEHPDFTFHPAKEGTYTYLSNILKEINVLFPSGMMHLGGDEVAFGSKAWDEDKDVQDLKQKFGYTTNKEVETYFMHRMADTLASMGDKLLVWDEMAEADLPKDKTILYWWRHDKVSQLELGLKNGYAAVLCPRLPLYFDFVQEEGHKYGRKWGKGYNALENVYQYDPSIYADKEIYKGQILGVQANLWTERVHNEQRVDYMVFPRIAALAEMAWTNKERKNYTHFVDVLKKHMLLYQADGIYFYDPFGHTNAEPKVEVSKKKYIDNPE